MTEKQSSINQTQFSFEEPIFENSAVYVEEKPVEEPTEKPQNKKKIIGIAIVGIVLILISVIVLISSMRNKTEEVIETEPEAVVTKELGPLQKRIEDARELLDLADPSKQDLAFPPVNMGIRLDPKEK